MIEFVYLAKFVYPRRAIVSFVAIVRILLVDVPRQRGNKIAGLLWIAANFGRRRAQQISFQGDCGLLQWNQEATLAYAC